MPKARWSSCGCGGSDGSGAKGSAPGIWGSDESLLLTASEEGGAGWSCSWAFGFGGASGGISWRNRRSRASSSASIRSCMAKCSMSSGWLYDSSVWVSGVE